MSWTLLKNQRTYDIECWRTTHRLNVAWGILRSFDASLKNAPNVVHTETEECDIGRRKMTMMTRGYCSDGCKPSPLPEWVTDEVLKAVWNAACELQTARGRYNRGEAEKARVRL